MKNLIKTSVKYAVCFFPLSAIICYYNINQSSTPFPSLNRDRTGLITKSLNSQSDLPCGFVARGKQESENPTFVTNAYIPILQFPSGDFPGTNVKIFNSIYSEKQNDDLEIQADGNLVLYCISCNPKKPLWSSQTNGKDGKTLFFMPDGDLVLRNSQGKTVWHSNIHSSCQGSEQAYFTLQDDGNLAMLYNDQSAGVTYYLGGTGTTNSQGKASHPGKIQ